ncbi:MAG: DNA polymerase IV [candidate division KSB1 bacterium]|jgi:nucleotidyltransferase/DNA polymerase involved in DNA repair|nr:DNA polymerase IV [candidate division KSB1 bacterium]
MERIILHIDMDAFFAAIEQRDHPEYRGKPVVVGADPKEGKGRGVVSTCSYEAREYGIHSAMPISQAYRRCPHAIYLHGRMERYQDVSRSVMKILGDFSAIVEPISIDEAFLDISGCIRLLGTPERIAKSMKQRIRDELGLTASVGIAPTKFVAKIASDLEKPDGLVIVSADQIETFLRPLPISKMWGVGKKTQPVLEKFGIRTIGDMADYPQEKIVKKMGKSGLQYWRLAHGIDPRDVVRHGDAKSMSQETTFSTDTDDIEKIEHTLFSLCTDLSRLLRNDDIAGRTVTLKIRLEDFTTFTRSESHCEFINGSRDIYNVIIKLFHNFDRYGKKVRLIGVAVSNLNMLTRKQLSLFEAEKKSQSKADQVMDLVQQKFGVRSIKKASLMNERRSRLSDQKLKKVDGRNAKDGNT